MSQYCKTHESVLLLGHHQKDFVETALMTGVHSGGFFGMRAFYEAQECPVARPLLFCTQQQIIQFLEDQGLKTDEFLSSDGLECAMKAEGSSSGERKRMRDFVGDWMHYFAEAVYEDFTKQINNE